MSAPGAVSTGTFTPGPDTFVAAEDLGTILEPGHDGMGWLAQRGYVPLGYLGDADKTATTFPVIDGVRYSVPGDRARHRADGVDRAARPRLGDHQLRRREDLRRGGRDRRRCRTPRSHDVVVAGRPSERWGQEVVAVVALADGRRRRRRRTSSTTPQSASPATSCPRRSCSGPSSSAARRARPTTGGPASRRSADTEPRKQRCDRLIQAMRVGAQELQIRCRRRR